MLIPNLLIKSYLINIKNIYPTIKIQLSENEIDLIINRELLIKTIIFFKFHFLHQFKILTCISGLDYPEKKYRFKIIFELLSIRYNNRLKLKIFSNEMLGVESITKLFSNAEWFESEIWDLFGIYFNNHYNLTRILTDYGFEGFPGRKNFPLTGYIESRYNEVKKSIVREIIELNQEYRNFKFLFVWEKHKIF